MPTVLMEMDVMDQPLLILTVQNGYGMKMKHIKLFASNAKLDTYLLQ